MPADTPAAAEPQAGAELDPHFWTVRRADGEGYELSESDREHLEALLVARSTPDTTAPASAPAVERLLIDLVDTVRNHEDVPVSDAIRRTLDRILYSAPAVGGEELKRLEAQVAMWREAASVYEHETYRLADWNEQVARRRVEAETQRDIAEQMLTAAQALGFSVDATRPPPPRADAAADDVAALREDKGQ